MMLTPGPGVPALIGGLALLVTEFVWARRMLERVKREALKVKNAVVGSLNNKKPNGDKPADAASKDDSSLPKAG
jgi:xanthosine utilization system XapX-like protein